MFSMYWESIVGRLGFTELNIICISISLQGLDQLVTTVSCVRVPTKANRIKVGRNALEEQAPHLPLMPAFEINAYK